MQALALAALAALLPASFAPPRAPSPPAAVTEAPGAKGFREGQVWSYRTRPGEGRSRLVVCRVDPETSAGAVVHVQVEGVVLRNPAAEGGVSTTAGHLPLAADALDESVLALEGDAGPGACAGFEEAHAGWRAAMEAGRAGAFRVSVAEALEVVQRAVDAAQARTVARPPAPARPAPLAMGR